MGNGGCYSINYERTVDQNWGLRGGVYGKTFSSDTHIVSFPILVNKYFSANESAHKFEVGLGFNVTYIQPGANGWITRLGQYFHSTQVVLSGTGTLGYRYMPQEKGMLFRIGLMPYFNETGFYPLPGISIGYSF